MVPKVRKSKEINRILTAYLRHQLGERSQDYQFVEETPIRYYIQWAMRAIRKDESFTTEECGLLISLCLLIKDWLPQYEGEDE